VVVLRTELHTTLRRDCLGKLVAEAKIRKIKQPGPTKEE
jgi:hypothetical protein